MVKAPNGSAGLEQTVRAAMKVPLMELGPLLKSDAGRGMLDTALKVLIARSARAACGAGRIGRVECKQKGSRKDDRRAAVCLAAMPIQLPGGFAVGADISWQ